MQDIVFRCYKCNQKFKAPEDMAGQATQCPGCGVDLLIPDPRKTQQPQKSGTPDHSNERTGETKHVLLHDDKKIIMPAKKKIVAPKKKIIKSKAKTVVEEPPPKIEAPPPPIVEETPPPEVRAPEPPPPTPEPPAPAPETLEPFKPEEPAPKEETRPEIRVPQPKPEEPSKEPEEEKPYEPPLTEPSSHYEEEELDDRPSPYTIRRKKSARDTLKVREPAELIGNLTKAPLAPHIVKSVIIHVSLVLLLSIGFISNCIKYGTIDPTPLIKAEKETKEKEEREKRQKEEALSRAKEEHARKLALEKEKEKIRAAAAAKPASTNQAEVLREITEISKERPTMTSLDSIDEELE